MPAAAFSADRHASWAESERTHGAPDRRCPLSRKRTYQRIPISITLALAGEVMVTTALASTTTSNAPLVTGASRPDRAPAAAVTLTAFAAPRAAIAPSGRQDQPSARTPRQIAKAMLAHRFGWKAWQFKYLNRLWAIESGWDRLRVQPVFGRLRHPAGGSGQQDGQRGTGLAMERTHPDPLGHAVHPGQVPDPVLGMAAAARLRLVLAPRGDGRPRRSLRRGRAVSRQK